MAEIETGMAERRADEHAMAQMLSSRVPHTSLPRPFYTDPDFFRLDVERVFERRWLFAALSCEVAEAGDFITLDVCQTSIIVCRDTAGEIRAFFNTCRHRGSVVADAACGRRPVFVCPYHHWSYDLTGRLLRAPNLDPAADKRMLGLRPVQVRDVAGLIFICLADEPPEFDAFSATLAKAAAPHRLDQAKVVHAITLREQGNWKLVMENARECDHCAAGHPELMNTLLVFDFADPWSDPYISGFWKRCEAAGLPSVTTDGDDFRVGRMPFKEGNLSITMDGQPAVSKRLGDLPDQDIGSLRFTHYPSVFGHVHADYAIVVQMLPTSATETLVVCKWIVHRDAVEGVDYDLERLVKVWRETNDQDRRLVERNQRGVGSLGYRPGPYAEQSEHGVWRFVEWYADLMRASAPASPCSGRS